MISNWIAMEYHRLHVVEKWPDSPRKEANLAAIRSSLASLSRETLSAGDRYRNSGRRSTDRAARSATA
jgi:hypothetical protein